jgi:hypothetical protein
VVQFLVRIDMKNIIKYLLISLFLCCSMENVFANVQLHVFKRNDTNKYIQVLEKNITYTDKRDKATNTNQLTLKILSRCQPKTYHPRRVNSKTPTFTTFKIVYVSEEDPENKLFLVCDDNNELKLVSEAENQAFDYYWEAKNDGSYSSFKNCKCVRTCNQCHRASDKYNSLTLLIEDLPLYSPV